MISIKSQREIELMRQTCSLAAKTLNRSKSSILPGVSTETLNQECHNFITEQGAYPSPLNYHGFPKSICTSRNHVICHGIPSAKDILKEGDIINVDVTTLYQQFHGDTSFTFLVGHCPPEVKNLVKVAHDCLIKGIGEVKPGARIGNIGAIISEYAQDFGYGVVREYCGHGIGRVFHEEPQILHYGKRHTGLEMRPGMTFTIEPMINLGSRHSRLLGDGWTVVTTDGKYSAQFEHTILVTESGHEVLTLAPGQDNVWDMY
jgi:methionyl aminopeptidase